MSLAELPLDCIRLILYYLTIRSVYYLAHTSRQYRTRWYPLISEWKKIHTCHKLSQRDLSYYYLSFGKLYQIINATWMTRSIDHPRIYAILHHIILEAQATKTPSRIYEILAPVKYHVPGIYYTLLPELKLSHKHYRKLMEQDLALNHRVYFATKTEICSYYRNFTPRMPKYEHQEYLKEHVVTEINIFHENDYIIDKRSCRPRVHYRAIVNGEHKTFGYSVPGFTQLSPEIVCEELARKGDFSQIINTKDIA